MFKKRSHFKLFSVLGISLLTSLGVLTGISFGNKGVEKAEAVSSKKYRINLVWKTDNSDIKPDWYTNDGGRPAIKINDNAGTIQDLDANDELTKYDYKRGGSSFKVNKFTIGGTEYYLQSITFDSYNTTNWGITGYRHAGSSYDESQSYNTGEALSNNHVNTFGYWYNDFGNKQSGIYNMGSYFMVTQHYKNTSGTDQTSSALTVGYYNNSYQTYTPSNPTAPTGYTFAGWYTDSNYTNSYSPTGLSSDLQLYAKYTPSTYTVSLDRQGGTGGSASTTATYNATLPPINTPTKVGYTFAGYYDSTSGGEQYYNASGTGVKTWTKTSGGTLYAQWTPNTDTPYTVNHYKQKASRDGYDLAETDNPTGTTGTNTSAAAKSYTGFTNKSFSQKSISGDGSTVVDIYYDRNALTLTFNSAGGSAVAPRTIYYDSPIGELPTPTKGGFEFGSWYTGEDGSGSLVTSTSSFTDNQTIYAKWISSVTYVTMTFLPGDHSTETGSKTERAIQGEPYTLPASIFEAANGYVFKNWKDSNNNEYNPGDVIQNVQNDMTFTAQYQLKFYGIAGSTRFDLSFDGNTYTATGVSFSKGDELQLFDISSGTATKVTPMGIHNSSRGVWKDDKSGTEILCDEDQTTLFNLSLPKDSDHWITTYTNDPGEKISAYVDGQRMTMTPSDTDMEEGVVHQWVAEFENTHVGDKISFQTNYSQTTKIPYTRDRNSNQYVDANGGLRISGSVKVWLKQHSGGNYSAYVTGMANSGFHFIADWTEKDSQGNDLKFASFSKEITYDQDIWQYGKLYHQYKLVYEVPANSTISAYNGNEDAYFSFGNFGCDDAIKSLFSYTYVEGKQNNIEFEGTTDQTFIFYLKCEDGSNYNEIWVSQASAEQYAIDFAKKFNSKISAECIQTGGHTENLKTEWHARAVEYAALGNDAKAYFVGTSTSTDEDIRICLEKYDYIFSKYWGDLFKDASDDFMGRFKDTNGDVKLPQHANRGWTITQSEDQTVLIVVIASSGLLLLSSAVLLLLLKKKKQNKN